MKWVIRDGCGTGAMLKFYDKTANLVWPSSTTHYPIASRESYRVSLNCGIGNKICYGAAQGRTYWGIGLHGDQGCESCCFACADREVSYDLTCR